MSHNSKFVAAYAMFVILPILGLAGILGYGRTLTATVSVGGWWQLRVNSGELPRPLCVDPLPAEGIPVQVVQSGKNLEIKLATGRTVAMGVIAGRMIKVSFLGARSTPGMAGCSDSRTLTLTAQFDSQNDPGVAKGGLSVDACAPCKPVEFHAVRKSKAVEMKEK
jgi:hypothetical protein